jgi:LysR family transcriptional regulator, glycine cleavage system transcriptional activator
MGRLLRSAARPVTKLAQEVLRKVKQPSMLPQMSSLRAFEAAARLGSFADAAVELSVTTSAISHQVRSLESHLRVALFVRERQRVRLNPDGQRLLPAVRRALNELSEAIVELRKDRVSARVTVLPSIAHRWLLPRLGRFVAAHPHVDLHISSNQALSDLSRDGFDLGLRFGCSPWPGLCSMKLADEALLPVASPGLLSSVGVSDLSALGRAPLLRDEYHLWSDYLRARHIAADGMRFGTQFGDSGQLLESAEAGDGIALSRAWLTKDALARGDLVAIGPPVRLHGSGYHLVLSRPLDDCGLGAQAFARWIRLMFAEETDSATLG